MGDTFLKWTPWEHHEQNSCDRNCGPRAVQCHSELPPLNPGTYILLAIDRRKPPAFRLGDESRAARRRRTVRRTVHSSWQPSIYYALLFA